MVWLHLDIESDFIRCCVKAQYRIHKDCAFAHQQVLMIKRTGYFPPGHEVCRLMFETVESNILLWTYHYNDVTWASWRLKSPPPLLFALMAFCEGNPSVNSGFLSQRTNNVWFHEGVMQTRDVIYFETDLLKNWSLIYHYSNILPLQRNSNRRMPC